MFFLGELVCFRLAQTYGYLSCMKFDFNAEKSLFNEKFLFERTSYRFSSIFLIFERGW